MTTELSFDELHKKYKNKVMKHKHNNKDKYMFSFYYRLLFCLKEPQNRYNLILTVQMNYNKIDLVLDHLLKIGIIKEVPYNPNKFMLTIKGNLLLYKITEINKLMKDIVLLHDKKMKT